MPTLVQLSTYGRTLKKRRNKVAPFKGAPQKKAIVHKISITTPRKPNSAKRKRAKVNVLYSNKIIFAHVPGIGPHGLQSYSLVLVEGGGPKDTPGVNYSLIRGVYDFEKVELFGRKKRRSKFGVKKPRLYIYDY
jgi:small subunit ribosomal protein S12